MRWGWFVLLPDGGYSSNKLPNNFRCLNFNAPEFRRYVAILAPGLIILLSLPNYRITTYWITLGYTTKCPKVVTVIRNWAVKEEVSKFFHERS